MLQSFMLECAWCLYKTNDGIHGFVYIVYEYDICLTALHIPVIVLVSNVIWSIVRMYAGKSFGR